MTINLHSLIFNKIGYIIFNTSRDFFYRNFGNEKKSKDHNNANKEPKEREKKIILESNNKSENNEEVYKDFMNGTLENNVSEKNSDEKEDNKTQIEVPEDFFYKGKNSYQCKDIDLLKKIYEIKKSFPKIELYLKNQGCKNIPSCITIERITKKLFESRLKYNTWRLNIRLREIQDVAKRKDGKCLSPEYKNNRTKLKFRCKKGHEFEATPDKVKNKGTWCPKCEKVQKLTLNMFQNIAKERGGKCLSTEYRNNKDKLKFRCKKGHEFEATPNRVKNEDKWCPICTERAGERICRGLFGAIFNKDFKKARPEWLKNSEGNQLELDGYNDELRIAFERQGEQHYKFPNFFHKSLKEFISQLSNDQQKGELCEMHGVTLIEIPYWIKYDETQDYIIRQCKVKGINISDIKFKIDWKKFKWDTNDNDNRTLSEWV